MITPRAARQKCKMEDWSHRYRGVRDPHLTNQIQTQIYSKRVTGGHKASRENKPQTPTRDACPQQTFPSQTQQNINSQK